jgi:hypothetical protein
LLQGPPRALPRSPWDPPGALGSPRGASSLPTGSSEAPLGALGAIWETRGHWGCWGCCEVPPWIIWVGILGVFPGGRSLGKRFGWNSSNPRTSQRPFPLPAVPRGVYNMRDPHGNPRGHPRGHPRKHPQVGGLSGIVWVGGAVYTLSSQTETLSKPPQTTPQKTRQHTPRQRRHDTHLHSGHGMGKRVPRPPAVQSRERVC